jgi:hypothetical protein
VTRLGDWLKIDSETPEPWRTGDRIAVVAMIVLFAWLAVLLATTALR